MLQKNSFQKYERLCSVKDIQVLYQNGDSFFEHPFLVKFKLVESNSFPLQVLFSVPKRKIKKAVHRNKIKRLCREGYRKNKSSLLTTLEEKNLFLQVMFIYTGNAIPTYKFTEQKIILTLQRLQKEMGK